MAQIFFHIHDTLKLFDEPGIESRSLMDRFDVNTMPHRLSDEQYAVYMRYIKSA